MSLCGGIKRYFTQSSVVQKAGAKLLHCILTFFACLSPCWTFLFIKTPESKMTKIDTNIEAIEKWIPNPFSDQPVKIDATNTQRHGSKTTFNLRN